MTSIEPSSGASHGYDAYEYIAHSHTYINELTPAAKFTYDLSPVQVSAPRLAAPPPARAPLRLWCVRSAAGGTTS